MHATRPLQTLLVGGMLFFPSPTAGQDDIRRVSMSEALELFNRNSLALRIARADSSAAIGSARQTRAYPNPAFTFVREDLDRSDDDYWESTIGVTQQVEWPGRTSARRRAATHLVEGAAATFRADSLRLAFEVREVWIRAWLAEETERTVEETAGLIRIAADAADRRLESGDISAFETRRLRLERVRVERDLLTARLAARAARRTLSTLVAPGGEGAEVGPAAGPGGTPPAVAQTEAVDALAVRPDIEAAVLNLEAARAQRDAASTGWVPDPTVSLGYKDQADGFSGLSFGIGLPVPLFDRRGGAHDLATARAASAAALLDLRRREAENDVLAATERYVAVRDQLGSFGEAIMTDAEGLIEAAQTAYGEGELTLLELLDAARTYRDARAGAATLRSEAWIGYYDVMRAMGRDPEEER
ncbi:MAG: TolC family protein [Gemmatimonadota bacterium]|nr:TolC family protein [Gemmatimonadota bacterium]